MSYGIVVVGYNRQKGLERLLEALNNAKYQNYSPLLIISLDYSGISEIKETAEKFQWRHGDLIPADQETGTLQYKGSHYPSGRRKRLHHDYCHLFFQKLSGKPHRGGKDRRLQ